MGVGGVVGDYDVVSFKLEGCASLEEPVEDFGGVRCRWVVVL